MQANLINSVTMHNAQCAFSHSDIYSDHYHVYTATYSEVLLKPTHDQFLFITVCLIVL